MRGHDDSSKSHRTLGSRQKRMPKWGDLLSSDDVDSLWAFVSAAGKQ
jgi:hypothetical protein